MNRRDFVRLTALAACAPPLRGAARDLIDKTIYALGGDAFRYMTHRVETGRAYSFYHEQLSGLSTARLYTKYLPPESAAPVKQLQRQVLGKKQDESILFSERGAWDITFRGAKPLPPERLEQFRNSTLHDVFYILRERLSEPGLGMEIRGQDVVENQSTEKVEIWDSEDRTVTVWISSTTFFPVQQRFSRWDASISARREEVTHYSNYRESGNGVMLPWATERERDQERIFQMYSDHVSVTQPVADALFELPPNATILKK